MMACLGKKEAESEKTEPDPGNEAVHRWASRDLKGRGRSDVGRRTEEAA
jgi:hypothetical protein